MINIDIGATAVAVLTLFGIYSLMAISLNLEYGVSGVPNFGKALFILDRAPTPPASPILACCRYWGATTPSTPAGRRWAARSSCAPRSWRASQSPVSSTWASPW